MEDKGKSKRTSSTPGTSPPIGTRQRLATWASGDVLPALSRRAAELEALARSLQADLETAQQRLAAYSEFDRPLQDALVDAYRGAQAIQQRARAEADSTLERALDERRLLLKDVERLRDERDHLTNEIVFARRGGLVSLPPVSQASREPTAPDHRTALARDLRLIVRALLEENFGPRPPVVAPMLTVPPQTRLRAPAATPRSRPVSMPLSEAAPAPIAGAIARPLVEDLAPAEAARLPTEISEPTGAPRDAASAIVESTATVARIETVAEATVEPVVDTRAIVAELGTAEIAPSDDLFDPTVRTAGAISEQAPEAVEMVEEIEAIEAVEAVEAVENVEIRLAALPDLLPESTSDVTPDYAIDERALPVEDGSRQLVAELNISADPIVDATSMAHEVTEEASLPPMPAPEPAEPAALASADSLAGWWDAAVAAPTPDAEVVSPGAAQLASPTQTPVEPPPPESQSAETETPSLVAPPLPQNAEVTLPDSGISPKRAIRELQLVLSPIDSFPKLLVVQDHIASLSSVHTLQLRDFRNGVATFVAGVAGALNGHEFGALVQMLANLRLRLEEATDDSVELRVDGQAP